MKPHRKGPMELLTLQGPEAVEFNNIMATHGGCRRSSWPLSERDVVR